MRRTIFLALIAALLLVPGSAFAADTTTKILRDCADDGILQGDYSASDLRTARDKEPAELEEYSDCHDVLSRAIAAKTAVSTSSNNGGGGGTTGGGGGGGGGASSGGAASPTTPAPAATSAPTGRDPGVVTGPSTPQDWRAIDGANIHGMDAVPINGRAVTPAASVGRNGMPGTLIAVLALLTVAALASVAPFVRRRVVSHRPA